MVGILTTLLLTIGQTSVPSVSIPPQMEPTVVFTDNGTTYIVGLRTAKVEKIDGSIGPVPGPTPGPNPPPVPVVTTKPAWLSLIIGADDTDNLNLRADRALREAIAKSGVGFRAYVDRDAEYAQLGLDKAVGSLKLPAVVLQKADGSILETRAVTKEELIKMVEGFK